MNERHSSEKWADKTNYYSLPRPYKRVRDSINVPKESKPAAFNPPKTSNLPDFIITTPQAAPQTHREQIFVLPSGGTGGAKKGPRGFDGTRVKPVPRPITISPQCLITQTTIYPNYV